MKLRKRQNHKTQNISVEIASSDLHDWMMINYPKILKEYEEEKEEESLYMY